MKFKPDADKAAIAEVKTRLGALPSVISEIKFYEFGEDRLGSDRSNDFALVSSFDELDSLKRYQVHPDHQAVVGLLKEICLDIRTVDYFYEGDRK
jgi:hypothetical protein